MAEHHVHDSGTDQKQDIGIVYADVGSLQPRIVHMAVDDNCKVEYAQIKIQPLNEVATHLESEKLEEKSNSNGMSLSADDSLNLDSLLIQVKPEVTSKWYNFGQALGLANKLLDACLPYSPEQNIVEVCDNWLRNNPGKPTWREVAEALKKIGFQQLARDIENIYKTGSMLNIIAMGEHNG